MPRTFEELKAQTSSEELLFLDRCWIRYYETGQHIEIRDLFHEFEEEKAIAISLRLTKHLVQRSWTSTSPGEVFQITALGALISSAGEHLEDLLERYLGAIGKSYRDDPRRRLLSKEAFNQYFEGSPKELLTLAR